MRVRNLVATGVVVGAFVACGGSSVSTGDGSGSGGRDQQETGSDAGSPGATAGGEAGSLQGGGGADPGTDGGTPVDPVTDGGIAAAGGRPVEPAMGGGSVGLGGAVRPIGSGGAIVIYPDGGIAGTPAAGGSGGTVGGVTLPDGCTAMMTEGGVDYCGIDMECGTGWMYAWCDMYDPASVYCSCEGEVGWIELELSGLSGMAACEYTASVCADPGTLPTDPADPPECMQSFQEMSTTYCSNQVECTQSTEIEPGVSVVTRDWQYTWCDLDTDTWTCSCDSNGASISFDLDGATAPTDACPLATDICAQADIEAAGPLECTPSYQSASTDWCDAEQDCTRSATISGTDIEVHEWVYTNCSPLSEGQWSCTCNGAASTLSFETAGDDAWSTCTEASATCVESLAAE